MSELLPATPIAANATPMAQQQDSEPEEEEEDAEEEDDEEEMPQDVSDAAIRGAIRISAVDNLDSLYGLREVGREALCWRLSSAKPGNGVEQIRDQTTDSYWQSDGRTQPHWIQIHFARRVAISHVCIYLDYSADESYTPRHLSVEVGTTTQDLTLAHEGTLIELNQPVGWVLIPLSQPADPLDELLAASIDAEVGRQLVKTHFIQISIVSMHQNGRDTHVRQVQLYGPRSTGYAPEVEQHPASNKLVAPTGADERKAFATYSTLEMSQYVSLR